MPILQPHLERHIIALAGAFCALMLDMVFSAQTSIAAFTFRVIDSALFLLMEGHAMVGTGTLVALLAGTASVFYFRPLTRKSAFAGGFFAIAIVSIFAP